MTIMIKVRHTDRQLYTCAKRARSDFMEGNYSRNINVVLKLEIQLLYPRWPLSDALSAGYSQFSHRSNFGYYRFRLKGTATLMIGMFDMKEFYEPWILIPVSSRSVENMEVVAV